MATGIRKIFIERYSTILHTKPTARGPGSIIPGVDIVKSAWWRIERFESKKGEEVSLY
jgi:hypothetical protein